MYYRIEEGLIWCLLTLSAIAPAGIPWYLHHRFSIAHWRAVAHAASGILVFILVLIWALAYQDYVSQGRDDGSSSAAALFASMGSGILIALNAALYLPWLKRKPKV